MTEKTFGMLLYIACNFRHQISDFPFNKDHTNYITCVTIISYTFCSISVNSRLEM